MKRLLLLFVCGIAVSAHAAMDPFSVYKLQTPEGCLDKDLTKTELGLPELIQIGICSNPTLSREYMAVKAQEASLGTAKAEYLPNVEASGAASISGNKNEHDHWRQSEPYSGNIGASWLLFDFGGRSARVERTKAYLDAAEFNYNAQLQETFLAINNAYLNLLGAEEVLSSAKDSEKSYKKAYEESSKRFDLGLVSLSDKLMAQTSYEQSKLATIQAENTVKQNQGNLAVLLNLSPSTSFKLKKPPKDKKITELETKNTVEELMELALTQRPELKGKESELKAARENVSAVRASTLPSLSASGSVGYGDSWKQSNPYQMTSSAGLKVSVPLFTGFADTYKVAGAIYQEQQASLAVAATQDSIKNEVWKAYQNYKTAVSAYGIANDVLKSAKENERVAMKSYEVGQGDILNLLTATSQMSNARQELVNAFYAVLISKANLYRAIGRF
ncbi:MAG: TolC family protein [Alphaproteobacteria bacterium]|nr:TolC family protein [Alphaproteobacteria bacterium]